MLLCFNNFVVHIPGPPLFFSILSLLLFTKTTYTSANKVSDSSDHNDRISSLENRIKQLESRGSKKYPDVKFLSERDRKRILVIRNLMNMLFWNLTQNCTTMYYSLIRLQEEQDS